MSRKILFLIACSLMICASMQAQTIVDDLEAQTLASDGRIRIDADPSVNALLGRAGELAVAQSNANAAAIANITTVKKPDTAPDTIDAAVEGNVSTLEEGEYVIAAGYRVQIYFGSDPKKARAEAQYRQSAVKNKFSNIGTYLTYSSPNFKVTVGDFPTREEAEMFKQLLIKSFAFGRESFIVPSKIRYVAPKAE